MSTENPTARDWLERALEATLGRVHTAFPATVLSYDPATQVALVQPSIQWQRRDPNTDALLTFTPPTLPNCPVAWLTGITSTLAAGSAGMVIVQERSTDDWRSSGGTNVAPTVWRRFDPTDAVFIPGLRSPATPLPSSAWSAGATVVWHDALVKLGDSSATDFVVLAALLLVRLNAIEAAYNAHTHDYSPGTLTVAPTAGPSASAGTSTLADISATKTQAV